MPAFKHLVREALKKNHWILDHDQTPSPPFSWFKIEIEEEKQL